MNGDFCAALAFVFADKIPGGKAWEGNIFVFFFISQKIATFACEKKRG
jgi:hypothetical protein